MPSSSSGRKKGRGVDFDALLAGMGPAEEAADEDAEPESAPQPATEVCVLSCFSLKGAENEPCMEGTN